MQESKAPRGALSDSPTRIGAYPILGVIGRGGMGTVYLAEDPGLKRRVALKVLPDPGPRIEEALARFRREARVLANLNHQNIATIFSLEEEGGVHFITMEYVVGRTLASCIADGALPPDRALGICRQIAVALEAAHKQGVIHRDLKPLNVMVTSDDVVKILDFGMAKVVASYAPGSGTGWSRDAPRTSSGSVLGTIGYMSPEQLVGREVDGRSDIWAFGCCVYECLSGRKAFDGGTPPEQLVATMEREPDWDAVTGAPDEVRDLIRRCLAKDPQERPPSITDAIAVIDRCL